MKRIITSVLMAMTIGCTAVQAQPFGAPSGPSDPHTLKCGHQTMTIDAGKGGKILSLKYDDQEVISQSRFPESFGSTFWTSPQKEWNWPPVPEFDKQAYTVEEKDGHLIMTSPVSDRLGFRIRKAFATDEKDGAFVITYSIINESNDTRKVAPWEITRVTNDGGLIFFKAKAESVWPAGRARCRVVQD